VEENAAEIEECSTQRGGAAKIYKELSATSEFSPKSLQTAYDCLKEKSSHIDSLDSFKHGNKILSKKSEALLAGYLLLCSHLGVSAQISEACVFSKHILGFSASSSTVSQLIA